MCTGPGDVQWGHMSKLGYELRYVWVWTETGLADFALGTLLALNFQVLSL